MLDSKDSNTNISCLLTYHYSFNCSFLILHLKENIDESQN